MVGMSERLKPVLRGLTTVFLAIHLIAISILAFPSPSGGLSRSDWRNPTVQGEFQAWTERLQGLGWSGNSEELQDSVFGFASAYADVHAQLKRPFYWYYRYCGTYQSWRMFIAPHRHPSRFQIRIRQEGDWRVVYEARHAEHRWQASVLDHDRMRSALFRYGWLNRYRRSYKGLGSWLARKAAVDFPGADSIQLRFANHRTPTPEEVVAGVEPEIRWRRPYTLDLTERHGGQPSRGNR